MKTGQNTTLASKLGDRFVGFLLFAFIPLTLIMMLKLPLGTGLSLLLAAAMIGLHRPLASRWIYSRSNRRCLWCGKTAEDPAQITLQELPSFAVCEKEKGQLLQFLSFCDSAAWPLRVGILLPTLGYFILGFLALAGIEPISLELRQALFRGLVALSVLSVALFFRFAAVRLPGGFPFPIHNLGLLGVRTTLSIFFVVGVYWLVLTGVYFL